MTWLTILLLLSSSFYAWRYSKTSVDPDWAYFNLWGLTGSAYGRDFADCKTPAIHLWYLGLAKIVGKNVARIKFANHFILGSVGAVVFILTGNFWMGLAFTVLVNNGWLLSFHGNVGQLAASFAVLGMVTASPILWLLAVLVEPKLVFSFAIIVFLSGWWWVLALLPLGAVIYLMFSERQWFKWVWESSVTIPARIGRNREGEFYKLWMPWFTASSLLYVTPWVAFSVVSRPDVLYWFPVVLYLAFIALGKVVRQNHLLPVIPWIALSGLSPVVVVALALSDFISMGGYFGNIWARTYGALNELNDEAVDVGRWLKEKPGTLYVNGIHSGIHIHAMKPIAFGFAEQIEIRETALERRKEMVRRWKENPPDWVVQGESPGIKFQPTGYRYVASVGINKIYKKL